MSNEQIALDIVGSKNSLKTVMETPDFKESLQSVANKYMTAEHIIKAALLAVSRQPKLLQCSKKSFLQSAIKAAELGLDFAGQTGQGYLIPFGKECQFIPGYQGFIEIAYRSGKINYIDAQLVYEKDKYEYNLGSNPFVNHQPYFGKEDRGKVIFGYAIVKLIGSDIPKIELMSYDDIMKIKARSKAKESGPWVTDEAEMMRKTILRRVFKYIPKTPEIESALEADNEQFDFGVQTEELKNDKSNLGANGLKNRMKKVKSKEVTQIAKSENLKQKAKKEIEKLKQAEQQKPKMYKCTNEKTCGQTLTEEQLEITPDGAVCPECGMPVTEVQDGRK